MRLPKHDSNGKPLLVLFDGMALAYRAYFAFIAHPLTNSRGENTSAVYGFMTALFQFLDHHSPTHAAVCFDTAAPTFRHEKFEAYKATRQAMPEDLIPQIGKIKELVRAFHIPQVELSGFEADDIIGTLAREAEREGVDSLIVTPDKDFCQLVTDKIKLLRPSRDGAGMEVFDTEKVRDKYGLGPEQIIDYLALVGDSSDNIPGVRGIGEKSATPLLQKFGSLASLYEHLADVEKKGIREKLQNERDNAFLSYELATIDCNVKLPLGLNDLQYGVLPDFETLETLVLDLGFKSLANRLHKEKENLLKAESGEALDDALTPAEKPAAERTEEEELESFDFSEGAPSDEQDIKTCPHAYIMIRTIEGVRELAMMLSHVKEFCVDLETTGSDANLAEIIGISFAVKQFEAFYVPIRLPDIGDDADPGSLFEEKISTTAENALTMGLDLKEVLDELRPVLENDRIGKVGQNIKYDALLLRHNGVLVKPLTFDTMIAAYLHQFDGSHTMDTLSMEYLKYRPVSLTEVVGTLKPGTVRRTMAMANTLKLAEYGAEDADVTLRLRHAIAQQLEPKIAEVLERVEFPLVEVLTQMEFHGVKIDSALLALASKEMEREAENLCTKIYEYAGGPFNIDSTKQLQDVLFNKLNLKSGRKTKTGLSTNAAVLDDLRHEHPIAECLLAYRQYQKLRNTYVDALPRMVNPKTGMIHTSYNQAVVATGRISSTDPNLQNIPIKTEMGRDIRKAFVTRFPGGQILSADYSQIELRIMAHVTLDPALLEAFANGEDIHTRTAAGVYGIPLEEVTREMRSRAKGVNYGIMYGIGAFGLARNVGIPQKEASEIIAKYFAAFPSIRKYMDDTIAFARKNGYVETLLGRRRYMRNIGAANQAVRSGDERAAINAPIQGTAADMMKLAMINIHHEMRLRDLKSLMIMQVHDELVFDVVSGEADEMMALVKDLMSNAMPMAVPIEVEAGIGPTWFEAH